jgi:hypothetical protein
MREVVLREIELDADRHSPTGNTRHFVGGALWEGTRGLRIVRYPGDAGCILLYLDEAGNEVTDTWHESVTDAMAQAEYEFNVKPADWGISEDRPA